LLFVKGLTNQAAPSRLGLGANLTANIEVIPLPVPLDPDITVLVPELEAKPCNPVDLYPVNPKKLVSVP